MSSAGREEAKGSQRMTAEAMKKLKLTTKISDQSNSNAMLGLVYALVNGAKVYVAHQTFETHERMRSMVLREHDIDIATVPFLTLEPKQTKYRVKHFAVSSAPRAPASSK